VLTPEQKRELVDAAQALPENESEWLQISREHLTLPTLAPLLAQTNKTLEEGRGFAVLRGIDLPPDDVDYAYRVNWILALALGDVLPRTPTVR
jgi:hypothetical protein